MSKRLTRQPGEDPPPDAQRGARLLSLRPKRTLETWKRKDPFGLVVVTHPKPFGRAEARMAKLLRGSPVVNRHLDEFGSQIWVLCDGEHTVAEIARALEERFHERFEPALPRTLKFIKLLAERGLVTVPGPSSEPAALERSGAP
jgi:hypothetical protein